MLINAAFCSVASALIVRLSDMHTMAKKSEAVFHGIIGDQRVVTDDMGRLITLTDVEIIDNLYGLKAGQVVTVYQVGGQKDGVVMPLLGGHRYEIGREVILFAVKLGHTFVSYGAGQGKFDVVDQDGQEMIKEDLGNISAISASSSPATHLYKPSPLIFSHKEIFKREIKMMVNAE